MAKRVPTCSEKEGFALLDQLQSILEHDPQIDEVGFIHSSQLMMLKEGEKPSSITSTGNKEDARQDLAPSKANEVEGKDAFFWSKEHKLGISTEYLLPLYKAAKNRFMDAYLNYKNISSFSLKNESAASCCELSGIENEVMKHSKALLLLSSDFGTAWNARKLIISKREEFSIADELLVSTLVLSFAPKSESAWNYRRWIINRIAGKCPLEVILEKEFDLVEKIAENSKMNYRAWNHRCWLIAYMTSEQKLMLRMLDEASHENVEVTLFTQFERLQQLWKDELDWNEVLIRRYIGREALWLHRRFLAVCWAKHFGTNNIMWKHLSDKSGGVDNVSIFIDNEVGLVRDCLTLSDTIFEDIESQAIHSAAYILWLNREIHSPSKIELNQKLGIGDLRTFLNKMCPEKVRVWDCLLGEHTSRDRAY